MSRPSTASIPELAKLHEENPEVWTFKRLAHVFGYRQSYIKHKIRIRLGLVKPYGKRQRSPRLPVAKPVIQEPLPVRPQPIYGPSIIRREIQEKLMTRGR